MIDNTPLQQFIEALIVELEKLATSTTSAAMLRINKIDSLKDQFSSLLKTQRDAFLKAYNTLVSSCTKDAVNETSVNSIITELRQWLPDAEDKFPSITITKVKNVQVAKITDDTEKLGNLLYDLCEFDAIFDLVSGNLHRLDPVIQDAGCQWRVPFVVDVHAIAMEACKTWNIKSKEQASECIQQYFDIRGKGLNIRTLLVEYNSLRDSKNNSKHKGKGQSPEESHLLNFVTYHCGPVKAQLDEICNSTRHIPAFVLHIKDSILSWGAQVSKTFDTARYLTLCKLFTINRFRKMDNFGLSGVRIDYKLPLTKKQEEYYTLFLANHSLDYMLHIARQVQVMDDVEENKKSISTAIYELINGQKFKTSQNNVDYDTHAFYGGLRLLFAYQSMKQQPLIIDIKRLKCTPLNDIAFTDTKKKIDYPNAQYDFMGGAIMYFEPDHNGYFVYVDDPTDEQKSKVGMCVECFSVYRPDHVPPQQVQYLFPEDFIDYMDVLAYRCPIVDMILCSSSFHSEAPSPVYIPSGNNTVDLVRDHGVIEDYIKTLYVNVNGPELNINYQPIDLRQGQCRLFGKTTENCHLWTERMNYMATMESLGAENIAYKAYVGGREFGVRIMTPVVFTPIHIYGCSYEIKVREFESLRRKFNGNIPTMQRLMKPEDEWDKED